MKRKPDPRQRPLFELPGQQLEIEAPPPKPCDECGGAVDSPALGCPGYLCGKCGDARWKPRHHAEVDCAYCEGSGREPSRLPGGLKVGGYMLEAAPGSCKACRGTGQVSADPVFGKGMVPKQEEEEPEEQPELLPL